MNIDEPFELSVDEEGHGQRIDQWLALRIDGLSRSRIQSLIVDQEILVDGLPIKSNHRLKKGESVQVNLPPPEEAEPQPEDIPLDIVYEDQDVIVVNKAAGMVVHPAPGHSAGTLVNALLFHCKDLSGIGGVKRPGIVHRLDADTTGLMVVAKNDVAHKALSEAMERREISRKYLAVIAGAPKESSGIIDAPIGRSRNERTKMAIDPRHGRAAITHWQVVKWGHGVSLLKLKLETGRTHQIRVHLASRMMPVLGDRVYGWTKKREMELIPHHETALIQAVSRVERQMLHATKLQFRHPSADRNMIFEAPVPPDMAVLIDAITPLTSQQEMEDQAQRRQLDTDDFDAIGN